MPDFLMLAIGVGGEQGVVAGGIRVRYPRPVFASGIRVRIGTALSKKVKTACKFFRFV